MKNIVGIRFRKPGKVYFFDPGYIRLNPKDKVIVETSLGEDIGEVVISKRELPEEKVPKDLKRIIRLASYKDIKRQEDNKQKERDILKNNILSKYNIPLIRLTTNGSREESIIRSKLDEIVNDK